MINTYLCITRFVLQVTSEVEFKVRDNRYYPIVFKGKKSVFWNTEGRFTAMKNLPFFCAPVVWHVRDNGRTFFSPLSRSCKGCSMGADVFLTPSAVILFPASSLVKHLTATVAKTTNFLSVYFLFARKMKAAIKYRLCIWQNRAKIVTLQSIVEWL